MILETYLHALMSAYERYNNELGCVLIMVAPTQQSVYTPIFHNSNG